MAPGLAPGAVFFRTVNEEQCANDCTAAAHIHGKPNTEQRKAQAPISTRSQCMPVPFLHPLSFRLSNNLKKEINKIEKGTKTKQPNSD